MKETFAALTVIALIAAAQLSAKGNTVRIVISGGDLAAPVEIPDPAVTARFNVWGSLNIDRSEDNVRLPPDLRAYEVSFVTTRRHPSTYVVRYGIDSSTNLGYVYLPGKADAGYKDNVWLIYRGIEGRWFHARTEWDKLINPWIERRRTALLNAFSGDSIEVLARSS